MKRFFWNCVIGAAALMIADQFSLFIPNPAWIKVVFFIAGAGATLISQGV
jgi:hypothetical protein